ncbi:MBL fold metallo-hydrolase [Aliikangiella sp. IMCC44653]
MNALFYRLAKALLVFLSVNSHMGMAHEYTNSATYVGNEGVLISSKDRQVIFDPFFHQGFNNYTLVPKPLRAKIFNQEPPFEQIKLVFISHAHADHFDRLDVLHYLETNQQVVIIAPQQAVEQLREFSQFKKFSSRVIPIALKKGDKPLAMSIAGINIEAVRIPHAGWPSRAEVENIVYRVQLDDSLTVVHMGDADPNISHFNEHATFWPKKTTDLALPPYWFYLSEQGLTIVDNVIKAKQNYGIHVPVIVPKDLKASNRNYFSVPGETLSID